MTAEYVFCPKCGTKNSFELSRAGKELKYFCKRCSARLNDFWEGFQNGQLSLVSCEFCQQPTFDALIYCISCGSKQGRVAAMRSEQLSKAIGDTRIDIGAIGIEDEEMAEFVCDCCLWGPVYAIFGVFLSRVFSKLPKPVLIVCLIGLSIGLVIFCVWVYFFLKKSVW